MIETLACIAIVLVLLPFMTYFTVKLATFAYLRAHYLFKRDFGTREHSREDTNGYEKDERTA